VQQCEDFSIDRLSRLFPIPSRVAPPPRSPTPPRPPLIRFDSHDRCGRAAPPAAGRTEGPFWSMDDRQEPVRDPRYPLFLLLFSKFVFILIQNLDLDTGSVCTKEGRAARDDSQPGGKNAHTVWCVIYLAFGASAARERRPIMAQKSCWVLACKDCCHPLHPCPPILAKLKGR
jgi:hypothetical protein